MPEADAVVFRQHCLGCPVCRHALSEESEIIRAFRSAGRIIAASDLQDDTSGVVSESRGYDIVSVLRADFTTAER